MNWLIASDIHGAADCCAKMLERFEAHGADRLLLLGDILYHGPRNSLPEDYDPPRVAALLNRFADRICCVRGNCDSEVDQMMLEFPITADYMYVPAGRQLCFVTHGHVYHSGNAPRLSEGDFFLSGHTHVPCREQRDGVTFLNPGSVSIHKGGSVRGYMTLTEAGFRWYALDGTEISV